MLLCGVLVVLGSQMVSGQGDAWLIKISSSIYGLPANQAEILSDRNSSRFREEQKFFCGQINAIFQAEPVVGNPVKERYYQCRIDQFQQSNTHTDAPVSFTYTLVFNGSDPIPKPIVDGLIAGNTETYQFGNKVWTLVGDWLISRINVQMRPGNLSDYMVLGKITRSHAQTDVSTYVDLKTELMNITTTDVMDPASDAFSTVSRSVCKEVSRYLAVGRFPSYTGCNITSIVNNTVEGRIVMNVRLTFRLDHNVKFPHLVAAVIAELAPRVAIGGHIAFKLGSVLVSETSLLDIVPGRAPEPQDRPDDVSTYVDLKTELMNITTTDVMDPASDAFSTVSRSVCKEVSRYLAVGRFPSYTGCNITSIVNNTVEERVVMNVRFTFGLDHNVKFPHLVAAVIAEQAPRVAIGGHIALKLGSVLVSETSLLNIVPGRAPEPQDRPDANPCLPDKTNVILPDPADRSGYIICFRGMTFTFSCDKRNERFDPNSSKCVQYTRT